MLEFFARLFSNDFMPHKMCYLEDAGVLWVNVVSDVMIALAYYLIPSLLFYFTRKRRDVSFNWIFVAFGAFILACGTTHLLGAVTVWNAVYRLEGLVKALTAVASIATFVLVARIMPQLVALPSPSQLARVNHDLAAEIEDRRAAEAEVRRVNEELEQRVALRTAALAESESRARSLAQEQQQAAQSREVALGELRQEMNRRQELENQLIHSQKMEAVGRLAGGVAHDFNNLLAVILGYSDMLREQLKHDAPSLEFAGEVIRAAERATSLTNQLLAFSRRQVAVPSVLDLNQLVRNIDKMLRRLIGEDVALEIRLAPGLSAVKADPSHLDQVIMNLAVNARDAMPSGGKLTIETSNVELDADYAASHFGVAAGHYVMMAVSDTGVGMDALVRSRLFEPFFTTKEKGKGTGLGLSIVYGIVKQNGGEILVYSEPGQGTVFKIYLPAVDAAVELPAAGVQAVETATDTGTIVLVEDEEQVRHLAHTMLLRLGYRVLAAASPAEALALVREGSEPIDLLLTDIVMPKMGGLELAREVQAMHPEIRVLFMSGYTDAGILEQTILTPETPFIAKPFTFAELQKKVRQAMRE